MDKNANFTVYKSLQNAKCLKLTNYKSDEKTTDVTVFNVLAMHFGVEEQRSCVFLAYYSKR